MHRASALLLGLCLVSPLLLADQSEEPELEFFEFLGEWQGDGEAWLDVQKLDELPAESGLAAEVNNE